jgi:hypothetical protein
VPRALITGRTPIDSYTSAPGLRPDEEAAADRITPDDDSLWSSIGSASAPPTPPPRRKSSRRVIAVSLIVLSASNGSRGCSSRSGLHEGEALPNQHHDVAGC